MREIIFGLDCVLSALSAQRRDIYKLLIYQNDLKKVSKLQEVLEMAQGRKVPVQFTTRKELDSLLNDRPHQVGNSASILMKFQSNFLLLICRMSL